MAHGPDKSSKLFAFLLTIAAGWTTTMKRLTMSGTRRLTSLRIENLPKCPKEEGEILKTLSLCALPWEKIVAISINIQGWHSRNCFELIAKQPSCGLGVSLFTNITHSVWSRTVNFCIRILEFKDLGCQILTIGSPFVYRFLAFSWSC